MWVQVGGTVKCWGYSQAVPSTVSLARPAVSLFVGGTHACAILVSGAPHARVIWGERGGADSARLLEHRARRAAVLDAYCVPQGR